jgi:glycosyltransferase involved in cell wall biosynthesis
MAARRPVVASSVGVNCDVVMEGVNGFFARTEDEWVERLEQFRGNLALTSQLGSAARGTVEASFSLKATVPKIAEILQSAAALRGPRRTRARTPLKYGPARSAGSSDAAPSR